jgi:hypothetical protein
MALSHWHNYISLGRDVIGGSGGRQAQVGPLGGYVMRYPYCSSASREPKVTCTRLGPAAQADSPAPDRNQPTLRDHRSIELAVERDGKAIATLARPSLAGWGWSTVPLALRWPSHTPLPLTSAHPSPASLIQHPRTASTQTARQLT